MSRLYDTAHSLDSEVASSVEGQLAALRAVHARLTGDFPPVEEPTLSDLRMAEREGKQWRTVSQIARFLKEMRDPWAFARELIEPVPELLPTFFQLGVLGEVLGAAQDEGFSLRSVAPLGSQAAAEHYKMTVGKTQWDVWMEAGALWSRYKHSSPYRSMTAGFTLRTRALSPDILIVAPNLAAFVVECKYSEDQEYVGRRGLSQTALYMAEIAGLVVSDVEGVVAVPEGTVHHSTRIRTAVGYLGVATPAVAARSVIDFVRLHSSLALG